MGYLIKNDFESVITLTDLDKLTDTDDQVWIGAEPSSVEEMSSYLRSRYDVSAEFDYPIFVLANTYNLGDRVYIPTGSDQGHYTALQDVPPSTAITNVAFWIPKDERNPKMIIVGIIILLYENYTRLNGSEIPNWLQIRYDGGDVKQTGGVIGYLKNIQRGIVQTTTPLLPAVADGSDQTGNNIAFGVQEDVVNRNTAI